MTRKNKGKHRKELFLTLVNMILFSVVCLWITTGAHFTESRDKEVASLSVMPTLDTTGRIQCTSPEQYVSWSFLNINTSSPGGAHSDLTSSSSLATFFRNVSTALKDVDGKKCRKAVQYGAAFGEHHSKMLMPSIQKPINCFFMFVLEDNLPFRNENTKSFAGSTLILVPRKVLPYKNMRRNVKLFKLHGDLIFPFTKVVVWRDVKLRGQRNAKYYSSFLETTSKDKACFAAVGLPVHNSSFGMASTAIGYIPQYQDHCETVANCIVARPNVTDSVEALLQQCQVYQQQAIPNSDSLHRALIDSAFIVWNQSSERCRAFNRQLASLWLAELQCHSDRDQISFPRVVQILGLTETEASKEKNSTKHSLQLLDKSGHTAIHILKSKCHWYFGGFPHLCKQ